MGCYWAHPRAAKISGRSHIISGSKETCERKHQEAQGRRRRSRFRGHGELQLEAAWQTKLSPSPLLQHVAGWPHWWFLQFRVQRQGLLKWVFQIIILLHSQDTIFFHVTLLFILCQLYIWIAHAIAIADKQGFYGICECHSQQTYRGHGQKFSSCLTQSICSLGFSWSYWSLGL